MVLNKTTAEKMLYQAYEEALKGARPQTRFVRFIDSIIDNTHKTFKYILFTALLSKATDSSINPLCLQAGSSLRGAYDARTICHNVIVPFEMSVLEKALGGSNEPFLNKPARFPELSKTNPVRRGNDQDLLNILCDNLPQVRSSKDAYDALVYMLQKLIKIREANKRELTFALDEGCDSPVVISQFLKNLMQESYEGETLTLAVAGAYYVLYAEQNVTVQVHPVNQCGASSKEISDLDIIANERLYVSNELKDKPFSATDIKHAADKVISAGGNKLLYVVGPRGDFDRKECVPMLLSYASKGFFVKLVDAMQLIDYAVMFGSSYDAKALLTFLITSARNTKFKEETVLHLERMAKSILGYTLS